jgi:AcrR family transcriptional regulator
MDRRIKRTRAAIFTAALELMIEKNSSKITVLELCKKADINKSTFYLHYKSMDECLEACFQTIMDGVVSISNQIDYYELAHNPKPVIDSLLDEVEKLLDYLCKFKTSQICGPSIKILKENLVANIAKNSGFTLEENYSEIATLSFMVGGFTDAVMYQLPKFDKKQLSDVICEMVKK